MTTPWRRYLVLQLPGLAVAGIVAFMLWEAGTVSGGLALGGWSAWLIVDLVMYPFVRSAYEPCAPTGAARLVGQVGVCETALAPVGQLRIRGELWRARLEGDGLLAAGCNAVVTGNEGLTLTVRPHDGDRSL